MNRGKESLKRVKTNFRELSILIVKLASMKLSFSEMNRVRKATNSMANSLEFNIIPKLGRTTSFISDVLEEQEREDLFRIKIFKKSEQRKLEAERKQLRMNSLDNDLISNMNNVSISK